MLRNSKFILFIFVIILSLIPSVFALASDTTQMQAESSSSLAQAPKLFYVAEGLRFNTIAINTPFKMSTSEQGELITITPKGQIVISISITRKKELAECLEEAIKQSKQAGEVINTQIANNSLMIGEEGIFPTIVEIKNNGADISNKILGVKLKNGATMTIILQYLKKDEEKADFIFSQIFNTLEQV